MSRLALIYNGDGAPEAPEIEEITLSEESSGTIREIQAQISQLPEQIRSTRELNQIKRQYLKLKQIIKELEVLERCEQEPYMKIPGLIKDSISEPLNHLRSAAATIGARIEAYTTEISRGNKKEKARQEQMIEQKAEKLSLSTNPVEKARLKREILEHEQEIKKLGKKPAIIWEPTLNNLNLVKKHNPEFLSTPRLLPRVIRRYIKFVESKGELITETYFPGITLKAKTRVSAREVEE